MALPTVVELPNLALLDPPVDLESVTEYRELPKRYPCQPEGSRADCVEDPCVGCQEPPFFMIAEEGTDIFLQFQAIDRLNDNPAVPAYGWRGASGPYFVGLEIVGLDGTLLWEGNTQTITSTNIANPANTGLTAAGPVQNIAVSVDRLLEAMNEPRECWYFRLRIFSGLAHASLVADSDDEPDDPPFGFVWLDFSSGFVYQWNGMGWEQIGPEEGQTWLVLDSGTWYRFQSHVWVGLAEPPRPDADDAVSETCRTFPYRLRRCNERILHFQAEQDGVDCAGFVHFDLGHQYEMDPIEGITFVDYFFGDESLEDHLDLPVGTTALVGVIPQMVLLTDDGWQWVNPAPNVGDLFLIMNTYGTAMAADVYEHTAWVPFVGYWAQDGVLTDHFPGAVFDGGVTGASAGFQHDFKILGSVEVDSLPIEQRTSRNGRVTGIALSTGARLRTTGIPELVARKIQVVVSTKGYTINGEIWDTIEALRKNNDQGALWRIDTQLSRVDCDRQIPC